MISTNPLTAFGDAGTLAAFGFLVAYYLITVAAPNYLKKLGELRRATWSSLPSPCCACSALGSFYPMPAWPVDLFPYIYLAWMAVGGGWLFIVNRRQAGHPRRHRGRPGAGARTLPRRAWRRPDRAKAGQGLMPGGLPIRVPRRPARLPPGGPSPRPGSDEVGQPLPAGRRRGQVPELLGDVALHAGAQGVVLFERRRSARCSTRWRAACAPRRARGGRWPASARARAQQLGHPPGQQAGEVLVAVVLVAEPLPFRLVLAHQEAGVVHHDVIRVAQAHREEHRSGIVFARWQPRTGATSAGVGRSAGARYWWSGNSSHWYADSRTAMAAASSSRRAATTSSPATKPPSASHSEGTSG